MLSAIHMVFLPMGLVESYILFLSISIQFEVGITDSASCIQKLNIVQVLSRITHHRNVSRLKTLFKIHAQVTVNILWKAARDS